MKCENVELQQQANHCHIKGVVHSKRPLFITLNHGRESYVKLVSQNPHHADKEVEKSRIRALALVKASIRMNSIR